MLIADQDQVPLERATWAVQKELPYLRAVYLNAYRGVLGFTYLVLSG